MANSGQFSNNRHGTRAPELSCHLASRRLLGNYLSVNGIGVTGAISRMVARAWRDGRPRFDTTI
jgi:hypothetical protein